MKKLLFLLLICVATFTINAQDPGILEPPPSENPEDPSLLEEAIAAAQAAAEEALRDYIERLEQAGNDYNTIQNFNPNSCAPDFGSSPEAMMPSTCDGNEACGECYTKAVGELNFIRRQLGRLSCIYQETKKFSEAAISFGDNTSGIHAVTGLSWQYARKGIVDQFTKFQGTYDKKYIDMMGALDRALKAIGACEAQYGLPDWYQRFGFIYYEFMKEKYKRTE